MFHQVSTVYRTSHTLRFVGVLQTDCILFHRLTQTVTKICSTIAFYIVEWRITHTNTCCIHTIFQLPPRGMDWTRRRRRRNMAIDLSCFVGLNVSDWLNQIKSGRWRWRCRGWEWYRTFECCVPKSWTHFISIFIPLRCIGALQMARNR